MAENMLAGQSASIAAEPKCGGVYLVVADGSEEFELALHYAADLAALNNARIGVFKAVNLKDFQHWGTVEDRMREELRRESEKHVWEIAKKLYDRMGKRAIFFILEGDKKDMLEFLMKDDPSLRMVVLAAEKSGSPGPLISHFTSKKGIDKLHVPMTVVPPSYQPSVVDDVTE